MKHKFQTSEREHCGPAFPPPTVSIDAVAQLISGCSIHLKNTTPTLTIDVDATK